jgi:hypothetical protein
MGGEPMKVPADVLPIGASLSVRESGLAARLFVPTGTAKFTTQSILPMVMMVAGPMMGEMGGVGGSAQPAEPSRENPARPEPPNRPRNPRVPPGPGRPPGAPPRGR